MVTPLFCAENVVRHLSMRGWTKLEPSPRRSALRAAEGGVGVEVGVVVGVAVGVIVGVIVGVAVGVGVVVAGGVLVVQPASAIAATARIARSGVFMVLVVSREAREWYQPCAFPPEMTKTSEDSDHSGEHREYRRARR